MVLLINKKAVSDIPENLQEFLQNYPTLVEETNQFTSQAIEVVDPLYSLYVGQQEYAVIPSNDNVIKVVGSDDATTCHIIILKSSLGSIAVAHFDGCVNECQTFNNMVSEIQSIDGHLDKLDVYVIGGYRSSDKDMLKSNESETISLNILKYFSGVSGSFNIVLWCTVDSNTKFINQKPFPLFNGLAMNRATGRVFPASFPTPLPCYILRSAMNFAGSQRGKASLYNYKNNTVSIAPHYGWCQDDYRFYATLSNSVILRYFSTSPLVEPITFCPRLKKVFYLLGSLSGEELFPGNVPKVYKINSTGEWIENF